MPSDAAMRGSIEASVHRSPSVTGYIVSHMALVFNDSPWALQRELVRTKAQSDPVRKRVFHQMRRSGNSQFSLDISFVRADGFHAQA